MQTAIYIGWILFPVFFLGHALWVKLERMSGRAPTENAGDYFMQGLFVLGCVLAAFAIDRYVLQPYVPVYSPEAFPLWFYQLILLPLVFLAAAKLLGGSKEIRIERQPHPSERRRRP